MRNDVKPVMGDFIAITKALSDPHRVRALFALRDGELCACQIIELLGLAPSTVSKHMSVLKQAGLVENRKEERWMYYRLPQKETMPVMVRDAFKCVFGALSDDDTVIGDREALRKITKQDLSKLCKVQRSR
ncbi:MAG: winged helix-turn-helix transcriptional regulator [Chitinispirillaceae bacterium]|nr:winged helix-turn-helix transcriptional regulator [Chitinispirillaceae bacterium]